MPAKVNYVKLLWGPLKASKHKKYNLKVLSYSKQKLEFSKTMPPSYFAH